MQVVEAWRLSEAMVMVSCRAQVEPLRSRSKDLHVHCKHGYLPVRPAYQQLPIFVSLLSLLLGRRSVPYPAWA